MEEVNPSKFFVPLKDAKLSKFPNFVCISIVANPTLIALMAVELKYKTEKLSLTYCVKFEGCSFSIFFNCAEVSTYEIRFYINMYQRDGYLRHYIDYLTDKLGSNDYVKGEIDRSFVNTFRVKSAKTYKKIPLKTFHYMRSEFIKELNEAITYERSRTDI